MTTADPGYDGIEVREYGDSGSAVVLLHGGPGAMGYMAPVARELADTFLVLEPLQQGSSSEPLTVARHVSDLHQVVESRCGGKRHAIIGHSWGAMLALAYAAEHPTELLALVLIGCGTFDQTARKRMLEAIDQRMNDDLRLRLELLHEEFPDPNERLRMFGDLLLHIYSYELATTKLEALRCDARAFQESWDDMVQLQVEGKYPSAFSAIEVPVLMLHGNVDPHPGGMVRDCLAPLIPQLEYHEWDMCGHYPWLEKHVRGSFFHKLRDWLTHQFNRSTG